MARIAGIDLPKDKRIEIGLTYIYGIGRVTSNEILEAANVDPIPENITTIATNIANNNDLTLFIYLSPSELRYIIALFLKNANFHIMFYT